jgi:hypothetical protein
MKPSFVTACLLLAFLGACEEAKKPEAETKPTAAATPTPTPTPAPTPSAEPAPSRPKKKLSDCPTGNEVTIDDKALETELRKKLDKPTGAITKADLKRLKSLNPAAQAERGSIPACSPR